MPTPGFDKGAGSALVLPTQLGTIPGNAGYGWQKTAKATDVGLPGLVLPGCQGYYEADLITGVSNGAQITAWNDSSGSSLAVNLSSGTQPVMASGTGAVAGFNGLPSLTFDGAAAFCNGAAYASAIAQPMTLVTVCKATTITGPRYAVSAVTAGTSCSVGVDTSTWALNGGSLVDSNIGAATTQTCIVIGVFNGANSFLRVNGQQCPVIAAGAQTLAQLEVGARAGAAFFAGSIAAVLVFPRLLDQVEMAWLETFYRNKYQLF